MRKYSVLLCLFVSSSWAQSIFQPTFLAPTPSQTDWVEILNQTTAPWPRDAVTHPPGDPVSVARLRHKPSRRAIALFDKGLKYAKSGAWERGAQAFERAVSLDPDFSDAQGNLGVADTALGDFDGAALAIGNMHPAGQLALDTDTLVVGR